MKIKVHEFSLKSKYPFRIAHGVREATDTFIVEISEGELVGYGEATPVPYYGITTDVMKKVISDNIELLENTFWNHPEEYWLKLDPILKNNRFVQCAIDIALHDLWGKKNNLPIYKMLGLELNNAIKSNYTIGIDEIPYMKAKMEEFDFPIYKIKLGTKHDLEIVSELRKYSDAIFRVDANCGWSADQTIDLSTKFSSLGVEFIEQPLPASEYEKMKMVRKECKLPLIADESCITEQDVEKCIGAFDGINIKLAKCGGITPALRMIKNARKNNLKVMMGCMTESSIGISAIAQLLPLLDFVDMDGALLISNDPADGVKIINGEVKFTKRNGHGAILK
jgi:L-alanine-DL-glutamate epimerase-like enolase superfamily enzyme